MTGAFVLRGVRALDPSGSFGEPSDVAVDGGAIVAAPPPGARDVDAAGLWLMPGVFDCHVHLGMSSTDTMENLRTPLSLRTLQTARNALSTLRAGVTSVRDAGGVDAGVRTALERGLVDGPELQVSIVMLSQTGGHADGHLPGCPAAEIAVEDFLPAAPDRPPFLVDGADAMRRTVRATLRAGADWIKVCTSGGVFGGTEAAETAQLSVEEVAVAVWEAGRRGRGVMAHAVGRDGIAVALEAGVGSIEHGIGLDEEQARAMARAGTFLVPTLTIYRKVIDMVAAAPEAFPAGLRAAAADIDARLGECVALAWAHGVPVALGSDFADAADHGANLAEMYHLHRAGLPVEAALLAATAGGARLCGVADRVGALAVGQRFDALLLDDDPGDLSCFLEPGAVTGVFRAGVPVVAHERLAAG
ncbi:MAG TPA: amidohydrolase family protein [Baekduia sp.]|nr:amidohydrolase family protein [Baekduia sp.]